MEALFDQRAETFCLITSDSDFAYLCRKLRERGATVHIVGEAKTPDALRNASDQFFEWTPPDGPPLPADNSLSPSASPLFCRTTSTSKPKLRPRSVVNAVKLMAADTPEGRVHVGSLGSYLRRTDPAFSPQTYGHSGLVSMLKTYDLLTIRQEPGGNWTVGLAAPKDAVDASTAIDST